MKTSISIVFVFCLLFVIPFSLKAQVADKPEDISPLLIGETIPDATLVNSDGENIQLYDLIKTKPTVLVFYRGGWCPYCNLQLSALAITQEEIIELGYQIIAVSPDNYKNLQPTY